MKRYSRTVAQQCRYYEVSNIFEYMVETYLNGNITTFGELYQELCKEARKDFEGFAYRRYSDIDWNTCRTRRYGGLFFFGNGGD